ncbi:Vac7p [Saccharomyces cerevisiae YJM1208]|nr:Vac7p [Saccharomyces cerevisiae YJM1208]AJT23013.1 Vac7p [Saccharomyces cerevisiae YJM1381]
MTEEDRKLTVETETVEAPVANNLLLSNNSNVVAPNPSIPSASTSTSPLHREIVDDSVATANTTSNVVQHNLPTIDNNLMDSDATSHNQDHWHSDINRAGTSMSTSDIPTDLHLEHIGSVSSTNNNSNNALINHNPLSSHLSNPSSSLRNKKSSLLVASNPAFASDVELSKKKPAVISNNMPTSNIALYQTARSANIHGPSSTSASKAFRKASAFSNNTAPSTSNNIGSNTPPAPLLPLPSLSQQNKPKIIERPTMHVTNSREILLGENLLDDTKAKNAPANSTTHDNGPVANDGLRIPNHSNADDNENNNKMKKNKNINSGKNERNDDTSKICTTSTKTAPSSAPLGSTDNTQALTASVSSSNADNHNNNKKKTSSNNNGNNSNSASNKTNADIKNSNADLSASTSNNNAINDDSHESNSEKPTKADFFAARLATAVGENEISDSEETFVYESAANSTKNLIFPDSSSQQQQQQQPPKQQQQQQNHGITSKISAPLLNNNKKLLSRLKNSRHISTGAILNNTIATISTNPNLNSNVMQNNNNLMSGHNHLDELSSIKQEPPHQLQQQQLPMDVQSVDSYTSDNPDSNVIAKSPDKRSSLVSLSKVSPHLLSSTSSNGNTISCPNVATNSQELEPNNDISTKKSLSNSTLRHSSANRNSNYGDNKRPLRTTVSKIFDSNPNGAPLRRYSGVPDHVNLEDYIEQSHNYPTMQNSVKKDEFYNSRNNKFPHGLNFYGDNNVIEEENNGDSSNVNRPQHTNLQHEFIPEDNESDENDIHSMFYYNHKNDLETKPLISDYGEDEDVDDYDRPNATFNSYYGSASNTHELPLHGRMPSRSNNDYYDFLVGNNTGNNNQLNEYTPLRMKRGQRHLSRTNNSIMNGSIHMNGNDDVTHSNINNNDIVGYSPHNFYSRKSPFVKVKNFLYLAFVISSLLMTGFILGFLLATNKELQDVDVVVMDNVISSSDELIFDITVSAFNPGFFSISVSQVDLDIFAKSSYLKCDSNGDCTVMEQERKILQMTTNLSLVEESANNDISGGNIETVLLGTAKKLETPLKFQGGAFNRNYDVSVSSVKLLSPGSREAKHENDDDDDDDDDRNGGEDDGDDGDDENNTNERQYKSKPNARDDKEDDTKKWKLLIKHDYELIVRGSMKYEVPFFNTQKFTAIQKDSMVHPGKK